VRSRSPLPRIIIGVVTIAILVAGGLLVRSFINGAPPDAGKVVFSTDKPVEGQTVGCTVDHQVTTIKAGESVYATYVFKGHQGADTVSLAVTKDGAAYLGPSDLPTTDTNGLDCFADTTDLSQYFAAGTYKFTLVSAGTTIAEGSLVVTP
jgi:hypothetical protein